MFFRTACLAVVLAVLASATRADEVLYSYEGYVLPHDESAGWLIFDACEEPCSEFVENGHFVLHWSEAGDLVNYTHWIDHTGGEPPPNLWVEWRFRSNHPLGPYFYTCDECFIVNYGGMLESFFLYGDAVISHSGDHGVTGLDIDEFHTYRYECPDGRNFRISVDGVVFRIGVDDQHNDYSYLQFGGSGGCVSDWIPDMVNEWDFIRFGTVGTDEAIDTSDPPSGVLDPILPLPTGPYGYTFTVTFDEPNYVYPDEITVEVTGGTAPTVVRTRRLDNGSADTIQVVLDRMVPAGETTTFTFPGGETVNYTLPLLEACCLVDGDCLLAEAVNCATELGGSAQGPGSRCDGVQACCLPGGTCLMADALCCVNELGGGVPPGHDCEGDTDGDGVDGQCGDECPDDGGKLAPGLCGCGIPDTDSDHDGTPDCHDGCPNDPGKVQPGLCGCGVADTDSDGDTVPDCHDLCDGLDDRDDFNENGVPDCAEHIPTVSGWGLIVLTLLLLVAGKLAFSYRRAA